MACVASGLLAKPKIGGYGGAATEYVAMYQSWPSQQKVPPCPPSNGEPIYDDGANHKMYTMYDQTYVQHPATERTQCIRPPIRRPSNEVKFQCISTYSDNFRKEKGEKRKPFRPPQVAPEDTEERSCQKSSVNQQTYRLYSLGEFLAARREPIIIKPEKGGVFPVHSQGSTQLQTTVQDNFRFPGKPEKRSPIIPQSNGLYRDKCMDMLTTNRADYTHKQPDPAQSLNVPNLMSGGRKIVNRYYLSHPCNQRSTFQDDYIKHPLLKRPKSFKPLQQYEPSDIPFPSETLYNEDYFIKPLQGPPSPKKAEDNIHLPDKGNFMPSTQYQDHFIHPPSAYKRQKPHKPAYNPPSHGQFHDYTSYNSTYNNFDPATFQRRRNFKPVRTYRPPTIKFDVKSTAHSHYRGEPAPPSKICKPTTKTFLDDI